VRFKRLFIFEFIICFQISFAVNNQKQFVITNYWDPNSSSEIRRMAQANINVRGGCFTGPIYTYNATEMLRLSNGILPSLVQDDSLIHYHLTSQIIHQKLKHYGSFNPFGYRMGAEPGPDPSRYSNLLKNLSLIRAINPILFTYINLHPIGNYWGEYSPNGICKNNPDLCKSKYIDYIDDFFKSPFDAISFNFYVLYDNNPTNAGADPNSNSLYPLKYDRRCSSYPPFYYMNQLFAQKAKTYNKNYWAFGNVNNHRGVQLRCNAKGCRKEVIHYPRPTLETARFYVGAGMVYGAKGFDWFTYQIPESDGSFTYLRAPSNDTSAYSILKFVNRDLSNIGSMMMSLEWISTSHGTSTDPLSGEQNLPKISDNLNSILTDVSSDMLGCIAIGRFKSYLGKEILILFNKDIYNPTSFSGKLINLGSGLKIQRFLKHNRRWEDISLGLNKFGLTIAPGDYEMVVVNDSNSRVIGSTRGDGTQTRATFNKNSITLNIGNVDGSYTTKTGLPFVSSYYVGNGDNFLEGDFNGDGRIDLVHVITNEDIVRIWYSNDEGVPNQLVDSSFCPFKGYDNATADQFIVGDFDGNNIDDMVYLLSDKIRVLKGNGTSGFAVTAWTPSEGFIFYTNKSRYKVGDFNADNRDDLLFLTIGNNGNNYYRILTGQSSSSQPFNITPNQYLIRGNGQIWPTYYIKTDAKYYHVITSNIDNKYDIAWWPDGQSSHI